MNTPRNFKYDIVQASVVNDADAIVTDGYFVIIGTDKEINEGVIQGGEYDDGDDEYWDIPDDEAEAIQSAFDQLEDTGHSCEGYAAHTYKTEDEINSIMIRFGFIRDERLKDCSWC
jgi:hypothetical protein